MDNRCVEDERIGFSRPNFLIGRFDVVNGLRFDSVFLQILPGGRSWIADDLFSRQIFNRRNIRLETINGQFRSHLGSNGGDKKHADEHPDHRHDTRDHFVRNFVPVANCEESNCRPPNAIEDSVRSGVRELIISVSPFPRPHKDSREH